MDASIEREISTCKLNAYRAIERLDPHLDQPGHRAWRACHATQMTAAANSIRRAVELVQCRRRALDKAHANAIATSLSEPLADWERELLAGCR